MRLEEVDVMSPDDAFLIVEFLVGHRVVPHSVFTAVFSSLPSFSPRTSPRLTKGLALRARDLPLDHLPPSTLEIAAHRIAGPGAHQTWATADHATRQNLRLLVGESTAREILARLEQSTSTLDPPMAPHVNKAAANTTAADEAHAAQQDDGPHLANQNGNINHAQQDSLGLAHSHVPEILVTDATTKGKGPCAPEMAGNATASHVTAKFTSDNNKNHSLPGSSHSLMERNPTATTFEWDGLGDSDPERPSSKRRLPTFGNKPKPCPAFPHKTRKKWSEMQEKTLMEGVEKYGKGNWKDIKMAYPDVFEDRSTVDMKDKFRNMARYQCV